MEELKKVKAEIKIGNISKLVFGSGVHGGGSNNGVGLFKDNRGALCEGLPG
jgi:hypothetical protein